MRERNEINLIKNWNTQKKKNIFKKIEKLLLFF